MEQNIIDEKEWEIYEQYQNIIAPFLVELEIRDNEYPIEIFNEIRAMFTHLSRYKIQNSDEDVELAKNHIKRAILDCYKYLCVSITEKVNNFRITYRYVNLNVADNGKFLPKLDELETVAKNSFKQAKKAEIGKSSAESIYALYEKAYNNFSELDKFLEDSKEAILFASTHTKRNNWITKASIIVTIVSIIIAIIK